MCHTQTCVQKGPSWNTESSPPALTPNGSRLPTAVRSSQSNTVPLKHGQKQPGAPGRAVLQDALLSYLLRECQELTQCSSINLARIWYGVPICFCCLCLC